MHTCVSTDIHRVREAEVREQHRVVPREMNAKAEDAQQASGISGTLPATEGTPSSSAGAGKAWARLEFEDGRTIAVASDCDAFYIFVWHQNSSPCFTLLPHTLRASLRC